MAYSYDLVYADPPWRQSKGGIREARPNQDRDLEYKTISLKQIESILGEFEASVLFLWTIDKFLFDAQSIGENLGYKLHARIIWDKLNGVAPAFTIRYSHEYLLWMYKSPMLPIDTNQRGKYRTVMAEQATKHSKKPDCAYQFIESIYPELSKVELFARDYRNGWHSWGDELI